MERTYTVMSADGNELVRVTFSSPVWDQRVVVRFISDLRPDSVPRDMYTALSDLMRSGLLREVDWDPKLGLTMYLRRGQRRGWLINRLPGILDSVASEAREIQSADR